jgi:hypothetical protein
MVAATTIAARITYVFKPLAATTPSVLHQRQERPAEIRRRRQSAARHGPRYGSKSSTPKRQKPFERVFRPIGVGP